MSKIVIVLIAVLILTGCATNAVMTKSLMQMEENLLAQRTELEELKAANLELKEIMNSIDSIADNMDGLLADLKAGDMLARNYFNDVIVPYMRRQAAQIDKLKNTVAEME